MECMGAHILATDAFRLDNQPLRQSGTGERLFVRGSDTAADVVAPQPSLKLTTLNPLTQTRSRGGWERPRSLRALLSSTYTAKEIKIRESHLWWWWWWWWWLSRVRSLWLLISVRMLLLFSLWLRIHRYLARSLSRWPPKLKHPREENVNLSACFFEKPLRSLKRR
jgi:hypothetical protein